MKHLLLLLSFICFAITPLLAQEAQAHLTEETGSADAQALFTSKNNQLLAALEKKKPASANKAFSDVASLMQQHIADNMKKIEVVNDEERARIQQVLDIQNTLYSEAKALSPDLSTNGEEIIIKLNAFIKTI